LKVKTQNIYTIHTDILGGMSALCGKVSFLVLFIDKHIHEIRERFGTHF